MLSPSITCSLHSYLFTNPEVLRNPSFGIFMKVSFIGMID